MTPAELATAVDTYFTTHLDSSYWSGLNSGTKTSAVTMAANDVMSLVPRLKSLDDVEDGSYAFKAIAEQAVFLARNYGNITEGKVVTSESVSGLSVGYTLIGNAIVASRAEQYIQMAKREALGGSCRISRG